MRAFAKRQRAHAIALRLPTVVKRPTQECPADTRRQTQECPTVVVRVRAATIHLAMTMVLGHISALEYWLGCRFAPERAHTTSCRFRLPSNAPSASEIKQLAAMYPPLFSSPVHLLVSSQVASHLPIATHVVSTPLPSHAFVRIKKGLYVAVPELAFALSSRDFSTPDSIRLGYELCGDYSLSSNDPAGFFARPPLTSTEKMAAFLEAAPRLRGRVSASKAASLVLAPSASPAETRLGMVLCLPHLQGGLGLPKAELNREVPLTPAWRDVMSCTHLRCDMLWPEQGVGVEYDSDAFHTGSEKINADSLRFTQEERSARPGNRCGDGHASSVQRQKRAHPSGKDDRKTTRHARPAPLPRFRSAASDAEGRSLLIA